MNYHEEIIDAAAWVVCPLCDEKKCAGRFECGQIRDRIERHMCADSFKEIAERRVTDAEE